MAGSCLKRVAFGCFSTIAILVLLITGVVALVHVSRPEPPELKVFQTSKNLHAPAEDTLNIPASVTKPQRPQKPILISLDVRLAHLELLPEEGSDEIKIESNFDSANFNLFTEFEEGTERDTYFITFKNNKPMIGMLMGRDDFYPSEKESENHLRVFVPQGFLVDLDLRQRLATTTLDFSGLSLRSFSADTSLSNLKASMLERNRVVMGHMEIESSFGTTRIADIQNFRLKKASFKGEASDLKISNSGSFSEDVDFNLRMLMGEIRMSIPNDASLQAKKKTRFADIHHLGGERYSNGATINLDAEVRLGEMRISRGTEKMPISDVIEGLINKKGIAEAVIRFRELHKSASEKYNFSEWMLNRLGYKLLGEGRVEEAIEVFKLNVEAYPNYANGFDSLGEGYMINRQYEEAILNYQKSLEMDPENENAERMIAHIYEMMGNR